MAIGGMTVQSDTEPAKVVHDEVIFMLTLPEDPVLLEARRRGWYLHTGTTVHVCNSRDMFVDYHPWSGHEVILDSGRHAEVAGIGTVVLRLDTGKVLTLSDVFHMPTIIKCMVSAGKLSALGFSMSIEAEFTIEKDDEIVGRGYLEDGWLRLGIVEEQTGRV